MALNKRFVFFYLDLNRKRLICKKKLTKKVKKIGTFKIQDWLLKCDEDKDQSQTNLRNCHHRGIFSEY